MVVQEYFNLTTDIILRPKPNGNMCAVCPTCGKELEHRADGVSVMRYESDLLAHYRAEVANFHAK